MKSEQKSKRFWGLLLWTLTTIWFGVCFLLSSQNGTETGQLSLKASQFIIRLLGLSSNLLYPLNANLRMATHVIVFSVLSLLSGCASGVSLIRFRSAPLWTFPPCIVFAFYDEIRKANIPGRHCSFKEAGLNVVGCVLGCSVAYLIFRALNRSVSHKKVSGNGTSQ